MSRPIKPSPPHGQLFDGRRSQTKSKNLGVGMGATNQEICIDADNKFILGLGMEILDMDTNMNSGTKSKSKGKSINGHRSLGLSPSVRTESEIFLAASQWRISDFDEAIVSSKDKLSSAERISPFCDQRIIECEIFSKDFLAMEISFPKQRADNYKFDDVGKKEHYGHSRQLQIVVDRVAKAISRFNTVTKSVLNGEDSTEIGFQGKMPLNKKDEYIRNDAYSENRQCNRNKNMLVSEDSSYSDNMAEASSVRNRGMEYCDRIGIRPQICKSERDDDKYSTSSMDMHGDMLMPSYDRMGIKNKLGFQVIRAKCTSRTGSIEQASKGTCHLGFSSTRNQESVQQIGSSCFKDRRSLDSSNEIEYDLSLNDSKSHGINSDGRFNIEFCETRKFHNDNVSTKSSALNDRHRLNDLTNQCNGKVERNPLISKSSDIHQADKQKIIQKNGSDGFERNMVNLLGEQFDLPSLEYLYNMRFGSSNAEIGHQVNNRVEVLKDKEMIGLSFGDVEMRRFDCIEPRENPSVDTFEGQEMQQSAEALEDPSLNRSVKDGVFYTKADILTSSEYYLSDEIEECHQLLKPLNLGTTSCSRATTYPPSTTVSDDDSTITIKNQNRGSEFNSSPPHSKTMTIGKHSIKGLAKLLQEFSRRCSTLSSDNEQDVCNTRHCGINIPVADQSGSISLVRNENTFKRQQNMNANNKLCSGCAIKDKFATQSILDGYSGEIQNERIHESNGSHSLNIGMSAVNDKIGCKRRTQENQMNESTDYTLIKDQSLIINSVNDLLDLGSLKIDSNIAELNISSGMTSSSGQSENGMHTNVPSRNKGVKFDQKQISDSLIQINAINKVPAILPTKKKDINGQCGGGKVFDDQIKDSIQMSGRLPSQLDLKGILPLPSELSKPVIPESWSHQTQGLSNNEYKGWYCTRGTMKNSKPYNVSMSKSGKHEIGTNEINKAEEYNWKPICIFDWK